MSNEQTLTFNEGEHWIVEVTYQDADGAPVDLASGSVEWALSLDKSGTPMHIASTANGEITIIDAPAGRADINVPPASQSALLPGIYYHESRVTLASGVVSVQLHGDLTVRSSLFV